MVGGNVEGGWVNTTNIKEVPSQSCALWCVYMCVHLCTFSGEAQQVLTGPPSSLHSPRKPRLFFLSRCIICVCMPAGSICSVWVWCDEVIDRRTVTGVIVSSCGKRRTLQPHSFPPWGEAREAPIRREKGKRQSKQINPAHRDGDSMTKWAWNGCKTNDVLHGWLSQEPVGWLNRNRQDKNWTHHPFPWSHGWETLGTTEVYGKWLMLSEWCNIYRRQTKFSLADTVKGGQIQVAGSKKHSLIKLDCLSGPFPP